MLELVAELPMFALILQLGGDADGHRLEIPVMDVGGNDAAPARNLAADQLRLQLLALGDVVHLLGDDALRARCICDMFRFPLACPDAGKGGNLLTVYMAALPGEYLAVVAGKPLINQLSRIAIVCYPQEKRCPLADAQVNW